MRVLLIDDEQRKARATVDYLKLVEGWEVVLVSTPSGALAALETGRKFDLIVLDVMMPADDAVDAELSNQGIDTGLLLLKEIRNRAERTPVAILTARQDLDHLRESGEVQAYLQKPVTAEELSRTLKDLLGRENGL